ncbi:hypothetical protein D3C72_1977960 [compost metagenome]
MCADIVALPVRRCRVVGGEKKPQQVFIADDFVIKLDFDRLGMAGAATAHLLVAGIGDRSTGITRRHRLDARHLAKNCLGAPEAATGECCLVQHDIALIPA